MTLKMVGILTFHHVYNQGALLQAYALQKYVRDIGYDVRVIDARPFARNLPSWFSGWSLKKLFDPSYIGYRRRLVGKKENFDRFRSELLNLDTGFSAPINMNMLSDYKAVLVGSDQVWNPKYGESALDLYLLKGCESDFKKISYAACIGSEKVDMSQLRGYKHEFLNFTSLSTRDYFSQRVVMDVCGRQCDVVVDPTLLIDWSEFSNQSDLSAKLPKDFVFVYGFSERTDEILKTVKSKWGLPIVAVGMENEYRCGQADIYLHELGPLEFVHVLSRSQHVVTKSFHGLMLSIGLRKPVSVVSHGLPSISRIRDFIQRVGLEQIVLEKEDKTENIVRKLESRLDFDSVALKLQPEIDRSKSYLMQSLLG